MPPADRATMALVLAFAAVCGMAWHLYSCPAAAMAWECCADVGAVC